MSPLIVPDLLDQAEQIILDDARDLLERLVLT